MISGKDSINLYWPLYRRIYAEQGLCNGWVFVHLSVRPFVCPIIRPQQRRADSLLLSAVRARDSDQKRRGRAPSSSGIAARRSAANAGSAMLTAESTRLNTDLVVVGIG